MNAILEQLKQPLKITDVDFRVQSINTGGYATILAYKDARVDMNRLDAVCGEKWQKDYKVIEGNLYCGVAIKIEDEWLWRWDVGTESFSDKQKGQASDAFKRACFNWGIGRELYNYPIIQVKLYTNEFNINEYQGKKSAKQTYDLKLKEWVWTVEVDNDGCVKSLIGKDQNGVIRYSYPNGAPKQPQQPQQPANNGQPLQQPPQQQNNQHAPAKTELPWLNITNKDKNFTDQWLNLLKGIRERKVTSIPQVKKHYKLSKDVESKLINDHKLLQS